MDSRSHLFSFLLFCFETSSLIIHLLREVLALWLCYALVATELRHLLFQVLFGTHHHSPSKPLPFALIAGHEHERLHDVSHPHWLAAFNNITTALGRRAALRSSQN